MRTQTATAPTTPRTGRFTKKPVEVWHFTPGDLEYLHRLTKRMIALGAWESVERWTCFPTPAAARPCAGSR